MRAVKYWGIWHEGPNSLWNLHPWKHLKLSWKKPWVSWFIWSCSEQGLGLGGLQKPLPTLMILCFCESLIARIRPKDVSAQEPEEGGQQVTFPEESNFCQKQLNFEFRAPARNRLTTINSFLKCLGLSTEMVSQKSDFANWNNHALYNYSTLAAQSSSEVYKLQFCFPSNFNIYLLACISGYGCNPHKQLPFEFLDSNKGSETFWFILPLFFLELYTTFSDYFQGIGKLHVPGWLRIYFASLSSVIQSHSHTHAHKELCVYS